MGLLSDPHLLVEIYLYRFPASLGVKTLRLTRQHRPVSRAGAFYQPRIVSMGEITRSCTDANANYQIGTWSFVIDDRDNDIGALLDVGQPEEFWFAREAVAWVISYEGLAAGLTPATTTPVARGWMSDVQRDGRRVTVQVSDALGSQFSGFNLDKKALQISFKDVTSVPRDDTKDRRFRIALGEFSDRGAKDANGVTYPHGIKGLWPVYEVDEVDINALGSAPVKTFADPPVITMSGVVGATGQQTLYYAASLITPYGETKLGNVVGLNGANSRDASNYNWIAGTFDDGGGANKVRIWVSDDGVSFHLYLDESDYYSTPTMFVYGDGNKVVSVTGGVPDGTRKENDTPKELASPGVSSAQTNTGIFSRMEICLGYGYEILDEFASNLADGTEPKRQLIDSSEHGVTTIWPSDPEWPYPNPWFEDNGVRWFGFLQRGPKLNAHRDGSVTIAVNFCGPHDVLGNMINQAFRAAPFLLNEHCFKNHGTGYRNQTYGTLETYANGDTILDTLEWEAAVAKAAEWMGTALGYLSAIWIDDPEETWRQVIAKLCLSFGFKIAPTRFGQIRPVLIDTLARTVVGRHFRERIEIKRTEKPTLAYSEILNRFNLSYFYDQDAAKYRAVKLPIDNPESQAAHVPGGVVGVPDVRGLHEQDREVPYTSDAATATDVANRELIRRFRRPRYVPITVPLLGLDHDLGEECRLTDTHGLGATGDVATPVVMLLHTTNLDAQEVTLGFQDLRSISTGTDTVVGDESGTPTAVPVGDEAAVPPTAEQVG